MLQKIKVKSYSNTETYISIIDKIKLELFKHI